MFLVPTCCEHEASCKGWASKMKWNTVTNAVVTKLLFHYPMIWGFVQLQLSFSHTTFKLYPYKC